ncbi:hypothetical protein GCM10023340_11040 [Nocardioides marinquilinus]|uniref:HNH nuclease domain-containing protein n=1 Tax=Nocardioides marinquilinus TaxID=1210400 RepID=A0ABP9PCS3_9ACTN
MDGPSRVLDLGRSQRYATAAQRTALAAAQRTCQHDSGCDVPAGFCHAHHLDPWASGGRTDLARLQPLCPFHHRLVHTSTTRSHPMRR